MKDYTTDQIQNPKIIMIILEIEQQLINAIKIGDLKQPGNC